MGVSQCVYLSLNARCVNRGWVRIFDADEFKSYTNDRTLTTFQHFLTCKDTTVWQAQNAWVHPDEDWPALVGSRCDMGIRKRNAAPSKRHSAARHYYIRALLLKLIEQLASQGNHTDHIGSQCHFTVSLAQCRLRLQFPTVSLPATYQVNLLVSSVNLNHRTCLTTHKTLPPVSPAHLTPLRCPTTIAPETTHKS